MARIIAPVLVALLAAANPAAARILVIGDSNALGTGVPPQWAWTTILQRSLDVMVQVYGAPGMSVGSKFGVGQNDQCILNDIGLFRPKVAIFALGTNDLSTTPDDLRSATRATLAAVPGRWICITPPHIRGNDAALDPVRAVITEECTAIDAVVIDGARLFGDADLTDNTHLNRGGHLKLARAVTRVARTMGVR